ncbi:hypothetical protein MKX03_007472 [Papaver bracteatum]|nr:hypothetical protein MKX03_007472 [Papaver bracteatum]
MVLRTAGRFISRRLVGGTIKFSGNNMILVKTTLSNPVMCEGCLGLEPVLVVKLFDGGGDVKDQNSDDYPIAFI